MSQSNKPDRRRNRVRGHYLLITLLAASVATFAGCLSFYIGVPSQGRFRVVSVEQDGILSVGGSNGREFRVKLYGIRLEDDWQQQLGARGSPIPRVIQLANGGAFITEKEGRLVYDQRCLARGEEDPFFTPNIVEADGLTPRRDEDGNILAIVIAYWHPLVCWQDILITDGVAGPRPDIFGDPFVDHLRDREQFWDRLREREHSLKNSDTGATSSAK